MAKRKNVTAEEIDELTGIAEGLANDLSLVNERLIQQRETEIDCHAVIRTMAMLIREASQLQVLAVRAARMKADQDRLRKELSATAASG